MRDGRRLTRHWFREPPPNPAKLTDARASGYIARHGDQSWELDALDPATLDALIESTIREYRDQWLWDRETAAMEADRERLIEIARRLDEVSAYIDQFSDEPDDEG